MQSLHKQMFFNGLFGFRRSIIFFNPTVLQFIQINKNVEMTLAVAEIHFDSVVIRNINKIKSKISPKILQAEVEVTMLHTQDVQMRDTIGEQSLLQS